MSSLSSVLHWFFVDYRVGIVTEKNITVLAIVVTMYVRHGFERLGSYDLLCSCCFALAVSSMAPFEPPESVITGFKEKIEALSLQGIDIWSYTLA